MLGLILYIHWEVEEICSAAVIRLVSEPYCQGIYDLCCPDAPGLPVVGSLTNVSADRLPAGRAIGETNQVKGSQPKEACCDVEEA